MKLFSAALALLLRAALAAVPAQPIANLFDLDASCAQYNQVPANGGVSTLQQFANEAASMNGASLAIYQLATETNPPPAFARGYLSGLFGGLAPGDSEQFIIDTVLGNTEDFLVNGIQPPGNTFKARLYCNSNAFTRRSVTDPALQSNGQPATDVNRQPLSIRDVYATRIAPFLAQNGAYPSVFELQIPATGNQPLTVQYYFFAGSSGQTICDGTVAGETFKALSGQREIPVILLCSFAYGNTATLGSIQPQPGTNQEVSALQPYSFVLLHEMYHFCPWDPTINKEDIEDLKIGQLNPYALSDLIQFTTDEATHNAQNYAYFSLGAWSTANQPVVVSGQQRIITFASGWCQFASI